MYKKLFLICLFFFSFQLAVTYSEEEKYLQHRIEKNDKRYLSFIKILKCLEEREARILVETGTARYGDGNFWGDGGSTIIFGDWAKENNAVLHTIDITEWAINNSKKATKKYSDHINFHCTDSIKFLENFKIPIDFLYLDSFDFDYNNPLPSQEHHLKEAMAAFPLLHEKSIVMIDDCELPHGGKGALVIDFFKSKGWKILHQGYQTILIQDVQ